MAFFLVRTARLDDREAIRELHAKLDNGVSLLPDEPIDGLGPCALMQATAHQYPFLVAEEGGRVLGFAHARAHRDQQAFRWSVDACVYAKAGYQRVDVVRALYRNLLDNLREQGYLAVYAAIALCEHESIEIHEALGFSHIGVHQGVDLRPEADYWCLTLAGGGARSEPMPFQVLQGRRNSTVR